MDESGYGLRSQKCSQDRSRRATLLKYLCSNSHASANKKSPPRPKPGRADVEESLLASATAPGVRSTRASHSVTAGRVWGAVNRARVFDIFFFFFAALNFSCVRGGVSCALAILAGPIP